MVTPWKKGDIVLVMAGSWSTRYATRSEIDEIATSPKYRGLDSAGEPLLPPHVFSCWIEVDTLMIVERARSRIPVSWGRGRPGGVALINPATGYVIYVHHENCSLPVGGRL
jgi:hypothetical protein